MKNRDGLKLLASLNVSTGTLYGLNFATESESERKKHIYSLVFAYMSLTYDYTTVSPHFLMFGREVTIEC